MDLFEVRDGIAYPSVHALIIDPYMSIWNKDNEEGKPEAMKIFRYVELLLSPKKSNPYHGYTDMSERKRVLKEKIFGSVSYESPLYGPMEIMAVIKAYEDDLQHSSPNYDAYIVALQTKNSVIDYLKNVDLNERTTGGAMVIKPKDVTAALNDLPNVTANIDKIRDQVLNDLKEASKTRKDREIGPYER
jgi:hypothetical protein